MHPLCKVVLLIQTVQQRRYRYMSLCSEKREINLSSVKTTDHHYKTSTSAGNKRHQTVDSFAFLTKLYYFYYAIL